MGCLLIVLAGRGGLLQAQETKRLGDGNDGNRSPYVHWIDLLDEKGVKIRAADKKPQPFSTRKTCGECHDYQAISRGWHFAGAEPNDPAGRPAQPWVLRDAKTRTQIPISPRGWKGAFTPEQIGLSAKDYVSQFGSHLPGGGYGEMPADPKDPHQVVRREISGSYEINCLACHNIDPRQDSNTAALQAARENYRWIATASSGLAVVNGTASALSDFFDPEFDEGIKTTYNAGIFNADGQVLLDISRRCPPTRCYFCHSSQDLNISETEEWTRDEDVHLTSGLICTDCHRHGKDHKISRGFETADPAKAALTCEGCHLGTVAADIPESARLGAPKPAHRGIPTIHFEKLTCTACHSGTWPQEEAGQWRTARIHKIGLHGKHSLDLRQPRVYGPVFMKGEDGKIGPYRLFWPAYWGLMKEDMISPIAPKQIPAGADSILSAEIEQTDGWRTLTEEQIGEVLRHLVPKGEGKEAVYICGGRLYRLEGEALTSMVHPAAEPYAWPMAHDVRPAEQSLGVRSCADCHTTDSPFFFGKVPADSPVSGQERFVQMVQLQGLSRLYIWFFNFSFVFRPWMKAVSLAACGLVGLVLLAYVLKAVSVLSKRALEDKS
jgi:hypothetical protein